MAVNRVRLTFWIKAIISSALCLVLYATASANCFELKHYEFFIPEEARDIRWDEQQLNELIELKTADDRNWLVPAIVTQLAHYEAACGKLKADERFGLLMRLYSRIRGNESLQSKDLSVVEKLRVIQNDFDRQIEDDHLFPELIYTMDDGPFSGEVGPKNKDHALEFKEHPTSFGKLRVSNLKDRVAIAALDKGNNILWSRILKGSAPERYLMKATLDTVEVREADIATVLTVFVDGERLKLYMRPSGRFIYYTHSW